MSSTHTAKVQHNQNLEDREVIYFQFKIPVLKIVLSTIVNGLELIFMVVCFPGPLFQKLERQKYG